MNKGINVQNLNFSIPKTRVNFETLCISFTEGKYGLCGDNGVGKTSLLDIITNKINNYSGEVIINGSISYCKQNAQLDSSWTISELLGVKTKLDALARIQAGSSASSDYELFQDDWFIIDKIKTALSYFSMENYDRNTRLSNLSGGEITKLELSKIFLYDSDIIILDEPTNNLDTKSREILYTAISNLKKILIVVTHDRKLLNMMDCIVELSGKDVLKYTGSYDDYLLVKQQQQQALLNKAESLEKDLKNQKNQYKNHSKNNSREKQKVLKIGNQAVKQS